MSEYPSWPAESVAYEISYYTARVDDVSLLDRALIVDNARISYVSHHGDVIINGPANLPVYCVPVGGLRRGGQTGVGNCLESQQKVIDALTGDPGFPNPRIDGSSVIWGDDLPEVPDLDDDMWLFRRDWLYGWHYGYSLDAIVFHLGRQAAMAVHPDFLTLERCAGHQGAWDR